MKVLITSSRMPFALDAIRKLAGEGHKVFACDMYASAPASHSRYLSAHFTTASPSEDTPQFIADVTRIAEENELDLILPAFEEAFYLSSHRDRLPRGLFAADFQTLARLHDKDSFQQLARALGLPVAATSDAGPAEAVQPFADGPMISTYSIVHEGEVATHCTYRALRQLEGSAAIQLESIDGAPSLEITQAIARDLSYTGQISFEFVDGAAGLTLIECNPRMTEGLLLMGPEQFTHALLAPAAGTQLVEPGQRAELDFAVFGRELP